MSRFSSTAPAGLANSVAALALVRSLTARLQEMNVLSTADIEAIKSSALEDIGRQTSAPGKEARDIVEQEFP